MRFGPAMTQIRVRSERRIRLAEMTRVPAAVARNINAVVDAQLNQAAYEMRLIQPAEYICIGEKKLDLWIADVYAITLFCDEIPAEWRNA